METVAASKTTRRRVPRRIPPVRAVEEGRVYTAKGLQSDVIRAEITKMAQEFCWTLKTDPAKATISLDWLRENGFEALVPKTADDIAVVISRKVKGKEEDVLSLRFEQLVHFQEILFTHPPLARVVVNEFEVKEKTGVSVYAVMKKIYDRSVFESHFDRRRRQQLDDFARMLTLHCPQIQVVRRRRYVSCPRYRNSHLERTLISVILSHCEGFSAMDIGSVKCTVYANDGKTVEMDEEGEEDGEGSVEL